jgi:hypothetical protein
MEITVKGCEDCPILTHNCGMPHCVLQMRTELYNSDLFATCPLKTDSLTIKLATDENGTTASH